MSDKIIGYMLSETSTTESDIQIMHENIEDDTVGFKATLMDCKETNRNQRIYPLPVTKNGLYRENIQELIQTGAWFGEAGHPVDPTLQRQMTVVQENISHRILSFDITGTKINGELETTPTKQGYFMRKMILNKKKPMKSAFSLRAAGPVQKTSKGMIVQDPLTVVTFDWVFFPSFRTAYQTAITGITESGNTINESVCKPLLESVAIDFIKEESKNLKLISNMMDIADISLSENCKNVIIEESRNDNIKNKLVLQLEDYASNEITDFFNKF